MFSCPLQWLHVVLLLLNVVTASKQAARLSQAEFPRVLRSKIEWPSSHDEHF
jgi:hypothetical protein